MRIRRLIPLCFFSDRGHTVPVELKGVFSSHEWPRDFYANEPSDSCLGDYGFSLSKEGNGWENRYNYPNISVTNICRNDDELVVAQHAMPMNEVNLIEIGSLPNATSADGVAIYNLGFAISTTPLLPSPSNASADALPHPASETTELSWISIGVSVTSRVNYVAFEAEFSSTNIESSLLTIYWNTNLIGVIDESVEPAGLNPISLCFAFHI